MFSRLIVIIIVVGISRLDINSRCKQNELYTQWPSFMASEFPDQPRIIEDCYITRGLISFEFRCSVGNGVWKEETF